MVGETAESLAHPAHHLALSAETGPCDVSMTGLTRVSAQVCAANGGTGYACWHRAAKAAVMRMHADCMTQYTVSEDRGKALPGWKGTRNKAHDSIAMVPGACLAFVATWPLPSFLLAGCRWGGDAHGWDSGPGDVCCRAGDVYAGGRTLSTRCPICSLAGPHPGEDLGDAWHLTLTLCKRTSSVCGCA